MSGNNSKQGYLFVEAALFLPIFLIGVLTLGSVIFLLSLEEQAMDSFAEAAADTARDAYVLYQAKEQESAAALLDSTALQWETEYRMREILKEATIEKMQGFDLEDWKMADENGTMQGTVRFRYGIPFALRFVEDPICEETLRFRGFIGSSSERSASSFALFERADEEGLVWVFPAYGEHYHKENCSTICVYPRQKILTSGVRGHYGGCSACDSENLPDGSTVYCFPEGEVYHRGGCKHVTKYVISMEREQAEEAGYTPCGLCGG